jgi:hypothetical protein
VPQHGGLEGSRACEAPSTPRNNDVKFFQKYAKQGLRAPLLNEVTLDSPEGFINLAPDGLLQKQLTNMKVKLHYYNWFNSHLAAQSFNATCIGSGGAMKGPSMSITNYKLNLTLKFSPFLGSMKNK